MYKCVSLSKKNEQPQVSNFYQQSGPPARAQSRSVAPVNLLCKIVTPKMRKTLGSNMRRKKENKKNSIFILMSGRGLQRNKNVIIVVGASNLVLGVIFNFTFLFERK